MQTDNGNTPAMAAANAALFLASDARREASRITRLTTMPETIRQWCDEHGRWCPFKGTEHQEEDGKTYRSTASIARETAMTTDWTTEPYQVKGRDLRAGDKTIYGIISDVEPRPAFMGCIPAQMLLVNFRNGGARWVTFRSGETYQVQPK